MTRTNSSAQDCWPGSRRSQGRLLATVGIAASWLTAAVLGGIQAAADPPQPVAAHAATPTEAVGMSNPAPDAGSVPAGKGFPMPDPAPTF